MASSFTNQKGFTLLEMLVVLTIMSLLFLLSPRINQAESEELAAKYFLQGFLSQLENAQNYAVITGKSVKIETVDRGEGEAEVIFKTDDGKISFIDEKLELPVGMALGSSQTFWIKSDSGYTTVNSFVFKTEKHHISVKMQLGSGRYHIEKIQR